MELTKSTRRPETAIAQRKQFAIINHFGTKQTFVADWTIDLLAERQSNLVKYITMPSVVEIYKTYGSAITSLVSYNLSQCIATMGLSDKITAKEVERTAQMMLFNANYRVLNWAVSQMFFVKLLTGTIQLYSVTPYAICRSVDEFAKSAIYTQSDLEREHRRATEKPTQAVKWADFARQNKIEIPNLGSKSPATAFSFQK